jgi:hypothetical protein
MAPQLLPEFSGNTVPQLYHPAPRRVVVPDGLLHKTFLDHEIAFLGCRQCRTDKQRSEDRHEDPGFAVFKKDEPDCEPPGPLPADPMSAPTIDP